MSRRVLALAPSGGPWGLLEYDVQNLSAPIMIRKLPDGRYRLYSLKKDTKTGKRRNLGTFNTRAAAERHERAVQFFKRGH